MKAFLEGFAVSVLAGLDKDFSGWVREVKGNRSSGRCNKNSLARYLEGFSFSIKFSLLTPLFFPSLSFERWGGRRKRMKGKNPKLKGSSR